VQITYSGDCSAPYSRQDRTGLVGKVLGPNAAGRWFLITDAAYDVETDTTHATAEPILDPEVALRRSLA